MKKSIEDEGGILGEVERLYISLCTTSGSYPKVKFARDELLHFFSTQVMDEHKMVIEVEPIDEEVWKTLKKLPKSKAPRIDGMIVEVLLA